MYLYFIYFISYSSCFLLILCRFLFFCRFHLTALLRRTRIPKIVMYFLLAMYKWIALNRLCFFCFVLFLCEEQNLCVFVLFFRITFSPVHPWMYYVMCVCSTLTYAESFKLAMKQHRNNHHYSYNTHNFFDIFKWKTTKTGKTFSIVMLT